MKLVENEAIYVQILSHMQELCAPDCLLFTFVKNVNGEIPLEAFVIDYVQPYILLSLVLPELILVLESILRDDSQSICVQWKITRNQNNVKDISNFLYLLSYPS